MKNKLIKTLALITLLTIPTNVLAAPCVVTKGTGKDIGDEIKCGTEEFYLLENKDNEIKMLTKYNLDIGYKIEESEITDLYDIFSNDNLTNVEKETEINKRLNEQLEILKEKYPNSKIKVENKTCIIEDSLEYISNCGEFYRIITPIKSEEIKQNKRAKGLTVKKLHNDKANIDYYGVEYPIYGDIEIYRFFIPEYYFENETENLFEGQILKFNILNENGRLNYKGTKIEQYFNEYKETLKRQNVNVNEIDFIYKEKIEEILSKENNKKITLKPKDPNNEIRFELTTIPDTEQYVESTNIKRLLPKKYNWLFNTSFWVGSGSIIPNWENTLEFITTYGDYCSRVGGCYKVENLGVGLRPVVTIPDNQVSLREETSEMIKNPETGVNIIVLITLEIIVSCIGFTLLAINKKHINND